MSTWAVAIYTYADEAGERRLFAQTSGGEVLVLTNGLVLGLDGMIFAGSAHLCCVVHAHADAGSRPDAPADAFGTAYYTRENGRWVLATMLTYQIGHPPLVLRSPTRPPSWPL